MTEYNWRVFDTVTLEYFLVESTTEPVVSPLGNPVDASQTIIFPGPIINTDKVETLTNKIITDPSNNVAADEIISSSNVIISSTPPMVGESLVATDPTSANWDSGSKGWFGSGVDADLNIGVGVTVNLARDMFYNNLTMANNSILNTACFRVFVRGTATLNGTATIRNIGNNAVTSTGGITAASATIGGGSSGGNGGNAVGNGGGSLTAATRMGGLGSAGGLGSGGAGAAGGTGTQPSASNGGALVFNDIDRSQICRDLSNTLLRGGSGGGGGGGNTTNPGGGGGGGGSILRIAAKKILGTGSINANGGNGGNGTALNTGGGGGGGGGVVVLLYNYIDPAISITANAGTGGASGGGTGAGGGNGGIGQIFRIQT